MHGVTYYNVIVIIILAIKKVMFLKNILIKVYNKMLKVIKYYCYENSVNLEVF